MVWEECLFAPLDHHSLLVGGISTSLSEKDTGGECIEFKSNIYGK